MNVWMCIYTYITSSLSIHLLMWSYLIFIADFDRPRDSPWTSLNLELFLVGHGWWLLCSIHSQEPMSSTLHPEVSVHPFDFNTTSLHTWTQAHPQKTNHRRERQYPVYLLGAKGRAKRHDFEHLCYSHSIPHSCLIFFISYLSISGKRDMFMFSYISANCVRRMLPALWFLIWLIGLSPIFILSCLVLLLF